MDNINVEKIINPFLNRPIYAKFYFDDEQISEFFDMINESYISENLMNDDWLLENEAEFNRMSFWTRHIISKNQGDVFPIEFKASLVNEQVVEMDSLLSQEYNPNNNLMKQYKPYFFEFSGYAKSKLEGWNLFRNIIKINEQMKETDKRKQKDNEESVLIEENHQFAYQCLVVISDNIDENESLYENDNIEVLATIKGNILFSASPIIEKKGKLIVTKNKGLLADVDFQKVIDDSVYSCNVVPKKVADQADVVKIIENIVKESVPERLFAFNVGQANCISIALDNGKNIFFDIGLTKNDIERKNLDIKKAISEYGKIEPDLIILSHWDLDHILGIPYADSAIWNSHWVVPDLWGLQNYTYKKNGKIKYKYLSDSAKRLLKFLAWKHPDKIVIIDEEWKEQCIYSDTSGKFKLWCGKRVTTCGYNAKKKKYCITCANNFGLIITTRGNNKTALLAGDCDYKIIPNEIWKENFDYVVVPHHGSRISKVLPKAANDDSIAVLSYGIMNTYGHPDNQHIVELDKNGFEVCTTVGKSKIEMDL